ncbi:MFS general substrate transporter [Byssothecium circinans]|uniref:MFS general substrate transporter n=1 Tax=Byssothecium circinans TaxID=147558 RepID=A0A6A5UAE6_9PLEO|nr:MFS general substrate transporter [Byssothecium circinans]
MAAKSPRYSHEEAEAVTLLPPSGLDSTSRSPSPPPQKKKPWLFVVGLLFLLIAIIEVGAFLADAPKTRVFEANLCLRYFTEHDPSKIGPDGTIPEAECKIDEIQQQLAMIFGWQDTFDAIPGILLAVPFGALADKWGRKWIFAVSLLGLQLNSVWVLLICYFRSLPLQWTWLSSAFYFLGGGPMVAVAVAMTMISDVAPPDKRTTVFLYATAAVLLSEMIAPIMASRLMEKGDWLPLLLALGIQQVGVTIAVFCPETIHMQDQPEPRDSDRESATDVSRKAKDQGFGFRAQLGHFKDAFIFLTSDTMLMIVVFSYLCNRSGRQAIQLLIRYASKRYNWEIKKAALLLSFRAATNLVSVAIFIPGVNFILLKYLRMPSHWADIWLARGSIILLSISFFIMGVAFEPPLLIIGLLVYNLGTGYAAAMRSIAIHVVGGQSSPDIGKLMSLLAIVESIGLMFSGPIVNEMFKWGMDMGSAWLGLPFLGTAVLYGLTTVVTFIISVKDKDVEYVEVASDDEENAELSTSSTAHRPLPPLLEPLDPEIAQQQALAAATAAYVRAHEHAATERSKKRSSDLTWTKSTSSRKSLTSQGSHFPPREPSIRSANNPRLGLASSAQRQPRAPTITTEKFPSFYPTPTEVRPLSAQASVTFNENLRPSSQPKSLRQGATSATSQQIRKARSMYYASSVQTGSPIARPPAKYLTSPPPTSVDTASDTSPAILPPRTAVPSRLASPQLPVPVEPGESIDKARDKYLQGFQQRQVKNKPSLFLAPFKKRQDRAKKKDRPVSAGVISVYSASRQTPNDTTVESLDDFGMPQQKKDKRSFSGSIKNKIKKVFRRTSHNAPTMPVQQIEASHDYLDFAFGQSGQLSSGHTGYDIPIPDDDTLIRGTLTQRDIKRLTVIHEAKDSIGSEADRASITSARRNTMLVPGLSAFKEPMHMESLMEETTTPIDPKRVFSALMKEMDASKATSSRTPASGPIKSDNSSSPKSDVFESSATKELHSSAPRDLHSGAGKELRHSASGEIRPPSRQRPGTAKTKTSSIKSFGRAIKSTIRTVTPMERKVSSVERTTSVRGAVRIPRPDTAATEGSLSELTSFSGRPSTRQSHDQQAVTPSADLIEQRVARSKERWKSPLEENKPTFPRYQDRQYAFTNFTTETNATTLHTTAETSTFAELEGGSPTSEVEQITSIPTNRIQHTPRGPKPRQLFSPQSPSIYSRNTDGASILANDSVMSFDHANESFSHESGSTVIVTSRSVRRYAIGTPSPHRATDSTHSSRDWKAWLSHEVSELGAGSQEDIRIDESYTPTAKHLHSGTSSGTHSSTSTPNSGSHKSKSAKGTPSPKVYSDFSAPGTSKTTRYEPNTRSKRTEEVSIKENCDPAKKENVALVSTVPSSQAQAQVHAKKTDTTLSFPLRTTSRPRSIQPLAPAALNRSPSTVAQYTTSTEDTKTSTSPLKNAQSTPVGRTSPQRHLQQRVRLPASPIKLTIRPKSAFDLRNIASPSTTSNSKTKTRNSDNPTSISTVTAPASVQAQLADSEMTGSGRVTPGRLMAERFLRERSMDSGVSRASGSMLGLREGCVKEGNLRDEGFGRGRLEREDTPAFL